MVSSLVGKFGFKMRTGYAASKHALHGFYDSLRLEEYDAGIRVTLICPGFIRTELSKVAMTGDGKPLGSMDHNQDGGMPPEECARQMIRAIEAEKHEVAIGGKERFGVLLKRLMPGMLFRMSLKQSAQ
jgi:short-subunit dehydrogenase